MDVYLEVKSIGVSDRRRFLLSVGQILRVGRLPSNDVCVEVLAVSRFHCEVGRDGCGAWIRDLEARGGTRVGTRRLVRGEMWRLRPGDMVELPQTFLWANQAPADRAILAWNGGVVPRLAAGLAEDPAADRFAVLADALEEAGCVDAELLDHCRRGPHLPGCWAAAWAAGVNCQHPAGPREASPVFYETSGFDRIV